MKALLVAMGFLTRIPVPREAFDDVSARARSLAFYPCVGLLLGVLLAAAGWVMQGWPHMVAAALLLVLWIALTGALHLDGLADSADAWIGGMGDRERTMAIMKDPRCGPAGVVAIVVILLLKFCALASLPSTAWMALVVAALLARSLLTLAFLTTPYVRCGGMGAALGTEARGASWLAVSVVGLVVMCLGWKAWLAALVSMGMFVIWRRACMRRLQGMTGDTCGALAECVEAGVLLVWAIVG